MTAAFPEAGRHDIRALARWVDDHLAAHWQGVLEAHHDSLVAAYAKAGDLAFGTYQNLLFREIKRQMRGDGLSAVPALPGDFQTSREWGNADGTDQERWMWSVIHAASGKALGTLVHVVPHDHTRFRLPRRPSVFALHESGRAEVDAALSARSPDFAAAQPFHQWYENYLKARGEN